MKKTPTPPPTPVTTESKTAKAILQQPDTITIGNNEYTYTPPTLATLILVSEAISKLPHFDPAPEKVVEASLFIAKDMRGMGEVVAIMILGAKNLETEERVNEERTIKLLRGFIKLRYRKQVTKKINRIAELAKQITENLTPQELHVLVVHLLQRMQLSDFFSLTTFLTEINLTRPTKVVTKKQKTTASGQ